MLLAFLVLLAASAQPITRHRWHEPPGSSRLPAARRPTVLALLGVIAGAGALALVQPSSSVWLAGPYFVAIMAAVMLDRRTGVMMLVVAVVPFAIGALVEGDVGTAVSVLVGVVPWYLMLRLMRMLGERNRALDASREAQAEAAVLAERGRIAREMHDVLAHSLSALALQLETTRLLAHQHGADAAVRAAIDRAYGLAATGLDDARRVIAAARGEELPGLERLPLLTDAFGTQSGLPVALEVRG